jgi:hypothetical protein
MANIVFVRIVLHETVFKRPKICMDIEFRNSEYELHQITSIDEGSQY